MGKMLVIKGADFSAVAVGQVTPIIGKVAISVFADPVGGGVVTGSGLYSEGESVTLTATPASNATFEKWDDGVTTASRTIVVGSSPKTYTAQFKVVEPVAGIEVVQETAGANQANQVVGQDIIWTTNGMLKTSRFTIDSAKKYTIHVDTGTTKLSGFALVFLVDENEKFVEYLAKCTSSYAIQSADVNLDPSDYPTAKYVYFHSAKNWSATQE